MDKMDQLKEEILERLEDCDTSMSHHGLYGLFLEDYDEDLVVWAIRELEREGKITRISRRLIAEKSIVKMKRDVLLILEFGSSKSVPDLVQMLTKDNKKKAVLVRECLRQMIEQQNVYVDVDWKLIAPDQSEVEAVHD